MLSKTYVLIAVALTFLSNDFHVVKRFHEQL